MGDNLLPDAITYNKYLETDKGMEITQQYIITQNSTLSALSILKGKFTYKFKTLQSTYDEKGSNVIATRMSMLGYDIEGLYLADLNAIFTSSSISNVFSFFVPESDKFIIAYNVFENTFTGLFQFTKLRALQFIPMFYENGKETNLLCADLLILFLCLTISISPLFRTISLIVKMISSSKSGSYPPTQQAIPWIDLIISVLALLIAITYFIYGSTLHYSSNTTYYAEKKIVIDLPGLYRDCKKL
jgi:hypothetical protein